MTGYYDIVLGLIPLALVGITASLLGLGLELTTAVPAASLAAVGLMGHAMFVRTPVDVDEGPEDGRRPRNTRGGPGSARVEYQSAD